MTTRRPALWSTLIALPFLAVGTYVVLSRRTGTIQPVLDLQHPRFFGVPMLLFGLFIVIVGLYVQFIEVPDPYLKETEERLMRKEPTQKVARAKILASVPLLVATVYLLEATTVPYVYPFAMFLAGLYFMSAGLYRYWRNTLQTYYVTSERVISNYRFFHHSLKEIPTEKIRGIQERRSPMEGMLGIGSVTIASSGGGGAVRMNVVNIVDPSEFANEIRSLR